MRRVSRMELVYMLLAAVLLSPRAATAAEETAPSPPGLGEAGQLVGLAIESGRAIDGVIPLVGGDARQQLVVSGEYATRQTRDLTREVRYKAAPAGVVAVNASGFVHPLADGLATVTASATGGVSAAVQVRVEKFTEQVPVSFPNQIVPIFTKLGCNAGGCHGKSGGQNGFRLSLLGFEPGEDYEYLVKEARGRRLFPAAPEHSLLLQKATNKVPHGGGQRLVPDSHEYRLLRRWIAQGMPYGNADDPQVVRIEVVPPRRSMTRSGTQQVCVVAHYSDGSTEDVTRTAQFEPNDSEMGEADEMGLVQTLDLTGDVAVMVRYQGNVAVFRASVPLGMKVDDLPAARNFIDELVYKKLQVLGIPPSETCDDGAFLRRVTLDITGRLATLEECEQFLSDPDPEKRDKLIDRLLEGTDYADYFANKWSAILRNRRVDNTYTRGTYAFHAWLRDSLLHNKPYDALVRGIVAASGETGQHPPVVWYREVNTIEEQVEDSAQLFLGLKIQCARCHHHPFEKWSQRDYYGYAAFFSRVQRKKSVLPGEYRIYHGRGQATATNPKTGEKLSPTGLGDDPLEMDADTDPRHALVDWMAAEDNPFFARALVNRYWKHFLGRGIVEPEDDMRVTNPASNPELLDALAASFVKSGFDMKQLIRTICRSQTYQLSSSPNEYNSSDKQNFSRYYPKRLPAEVLLDGINQLTDTSSRFNGLPAGTRAVQLRDQQSGSYFLTVFGKPDAASACECERSNEASLAQSLHLLNSTEVQGKLTAKDARAARLAADGDRGEKEKVCELYLRAFSREPADDEVDIALRYLKSKRDEPRQAYEDIVWALLNTKEFLFNH